MALKVKPKQFLPGIHVGQQNNNTCNKQQKQQTLNPQTTNNKQQTTNRNNNFNKQTNRTGPQLRSATTKPPQTPNARPYHKHIYIRRTASTKKKTCCHLCNLSCFCWSAFSCPRPLVFYSPLQVYQSHAKTPS